MIRCFGYTRVSTQRQSDGASLDAQKDAITGFASQNNLEITKWFEETETASKTGRPVFGQMVSALQRGQADGLIIHKIDRSARNFSDWARLDELARLGISVFFAADSLDFASRGGRLLADIQMALAADYSRNLSLEVKKGIYGRAKQGVYPFRAPLGYLDTGGGNPKALDPLKAPLVKVLFRLYLTGEYSIRSLTAEMQIRGLKGFGDRPVVLRNVETILRNPFYCGQMKIGGQLYPGRHEPLITTAEYRKIQRIKENRYGKKQTLHGMLFRGLIHCARCNQVLTGERQKAHIYYRCHTPGCPERTIREDRLDAALGKKFERLSLSDASRDRAATAIRQYLAGAGQSDLQKNLRLRISDARSRQDRLTDLLVDGNIDKPAYEVRKQNIEFELGQLREELQRIERNQVKLADFDELLSMATDLGTLYEDAEPAEKRRLIRNCVARSTVQDGKITVHKADWLEEIERMATGKFPALGQLPAIGQAQTIAMGQGRGAVLKPSDGEYG